MSLIGPLRKKKKRTPKTDLAGKKGAKKVVGKGVFVEPKGLEIKGFDKVEEELREDLVVEEKKAAVKKEKKTRVARAEVKKARRRVVITRPPDRQFEVTSRSGGKEAVSRLKFDGYKPQRIDQFSKLLKDSNSSPSAPTSTLMNDPARLARLMKKALVELGISGVGPGGRRYRLRANLNLDGKSLDTVVFCHPLEEPRWFEGRPLYPADAECLLFTVTGEKTTMDSHLKRLHDDGMILPGDILRYSWLGEDELTTLLKGLGMICPICGEIIESPGRHQCKKPNLDLNA